jgi:hypothetical protein
MNIFDIYYENADTDDPKEYRMTIQAETQVEALQLASEYLEVPSHDLVAKHSDAEPTLARCPYCLQWHEPHLIEQCPLKPKR